MSNYSSYLVIVYIKIFLEFLLQYYRNHGSSYMISILIHRGCNLQGKKWKTLQDWPCHSAVYVVTSILFCDIFLIKEEKILKNSQVKKKRDRRVCIHKNVFGRTQNFSCIRLCNVVYRLSQSVRHSGFECLRHFSCSEFSFCSSTCGHVYAKYFRVAQNLTHNIWNGLCIKQSSK